MRIRSGLLAALMLLGGACSAHIRDLSLAPVAAKAGTPPIPLEVAYFMDEKSLATTDVANLGEEGNVRVGVGRLVDASFRGTLAAIFQTVSVPEANPFSRPQWTFEYPGYVIPSFREVAINGANQETQVSVIVSFYMRGRRKVGEAFLSAQTSRFTIDQAQLSEDERKEFASGSREAILAMSMRQSVRSLCEQLVQARRDLLASAPYKGGLVLAGPLLLPVGVDFEPGDTTRIVPNALADLNKVAAVLQKSTKVRIRIEVHAFDHLGSVSEKPPKILAPERATILRRFFQQADIAASRVEAVSLEDFFPIADNTTPEGWDRNDRIDFVVLK